MRAPLSRRRFISRSAATTASFYLLPHALAHSALAEPTEDALTEVNPHDLGFFSADERATLGKLCDEILGGASAMGAVHYIESLLTAFDVDPPRIFAGGPFSGRRPFPHAAGEAEQFPANSFRNFVPLSRAQEASWKLKLFGSSAFPEGWWNEKLLGPRPGLRTLIREGVAKAASGEGDARSFSGTTSEFRQILRVLTLEGCFSAPEYGGNSELRGWNLASFPGDSQPLGYTEAEVSEPDKRDPNSLGFLSRAFLYLITVFKHGKAF